MDNAVILDLTNYTRRELLKNKAFIIGKGPQCDYIVNHPEVAGMQCILSFNDKNWFVSNLSRDNPTLINDNVACLEQNIYSSDIITIFDSTALQIIFYEDAKDIPSQTESEEGCPKKKRRLSTSVKVNTEKEAQIMPNEASGSAVETVEDLIHDVQSLEKYKTEATALQRALDAVMNSVEQEFACCICSEVIFKAVGFKCGHSFCQFCLNRWLDAIKGKNKNECPICRESLSETIPILNIDSFIEKAAPYLGSSFVMRRQEIKNERTSADLAVRPGSSSSRGNESLRGSRGRKRGRGAAGAGI